MWKMILQLHKGSSSSSGTSYWKPNEYQASVLGAEDGSQPNTVLGNLLGDSGYLASSNTLRNAGMNILGNYINSDLANYDYSSSLNNSLSQISSGQNGISQLTTGELPSAYQTNMENSIKSGLTNTIGTSLNSLANRGVLNSSVTNQSLNDIQSNAANTLAQQYSNNISTLSSLYGSQISNANAATNAASTAQSAATNPGYEMLNAGIGSYNTANSVLGQTQGSTGTKTGSMHGSDYLTTAISIGAALCFPAGTKVKMADGYEENIENIKVGDEVISVNENMEMCIGQVIEIQEPVVQPLYKVTAVDDKGVEHTVECSASQPFMNDDGYYTFAGQLHLGEELFSVGKVIALSVAEPKMVYDLLVSGKNNYVANGFVSHGKFEVNKNGQ